LAKSYLWATRVKVARTASGSGLLKTARLRVAYRNFQ
jgi:hypothetical protein